MLAVCMALIDEEYDKKSFEKLYNKYENRVYTISYRILKNKKLAEDATSETFLSLAKCFQKIKILEHHKLDCYIVITSRNTAMNMQKAETRQRTKNLHSEDIHSIDDRFFSNDNLANIDAIFLKQCIEKLTDIEQQILYLKFSCGLKYRKIAVSLNIKPSAARKRLQYAKEKLKKLLEAGDEYE